LRRLVSMIAIQCLCACPAWGEADTFPDPQDPTSGAAIRLATPVPRNSVYFGGTLAHPMSPDEFGDLWKTGIGFTFGFGHMLTSTVESVLWLGFTTFGLDIPSGVEASGGSFSSLELMLDVKYVFNTQSRTTSVRPYFAGGLGGAFANVASATFVGNDPTPAYSEWAMGLDFGFGVEGRIGKTTRMYLEVKYTTLFTNGDSTRYVPVRVGFKLIG
jgi:hypothetical protein